MNKLSASYRISILEGGGGKGGTQRGRGASECEKNPERFGRILPQENVTVLLALEKNADLVRNCSVWKH